jgi:hypothetical protein
MKKLNYLSVPLTKLSYRGNFPRPKIEEGYFRHNCRIENFTEEIYRYALPNVEGKQLCINPFLQSLHLLTSTSDELNITSFSSSTNNGIDKQQQSQEQKFTINLSEVIYGGTGGKTVQLTCFTKELLALYLPNRDTVYMFHPFMSNNGFVDMIVMGKNSAFSPVKRTHPGDALTMYSSLSENFPTSSSDYNTARLYFCGAGLGNKNQLLRVINNDELLTIEFPHSFQPKSHCQVRLLGNRELLVESDNQLYLITHDIDGSDWRWQPIEVNNMRGDTMTREWSTNKFAKSNTSYFQTLQRRRHQQHLSETIDYEVFVSPRASVDDVNTLQTPESNIHESTKNVSYDKWATSNSTIASVSSNADLLEVVNLDSNAVRTIDIVPVQLDDAGVRFSRRIESIVVDGNLVYLLEIYSSSKNVNSYIRSFDTRQDNLRKDLAEWRKMWGLPPVDINTGRIQDGYRGNSKESGKNPPPASTPKHGKIDNLFHAGGNTFAGGTGGSDTAGLGGRGGPYRLDKGHQIHQLPDEIKAEVDKEVLEKAREIGKLAWQERLKEIQMNPRAHQAYHEARSRVETDLIRLRTVLESASLLRKERAWVKNQSFGDLDDSKLVDGLVGERLIYKRRLHKEPSPGSVSSPTNVRIVVDISASMYRFQSLDGRLQRMIDTTLMLLEAMQELHQFRISISGHSGESPSVPLVDWDQLPKDEGAIFKVLETMAAHAQYCVSGDHTVEAVYAAVESILEQDEEAGGLVIVVSDANLRRYGIAPSDLAKAMHASETVKTNVVFIASVRDEAEVLVKELPFGRAKVCLDTSELPHVMREILADASQALSQ